MTHWSAKTPAGTESNNTSGRFKLLTYTPSSTASGGINFAPQVSTAMPFYISDDSRIFLYDSGESRVF